jgi:16S rRNA (uracil1498-N3)-methyltransferase
MSAPVFFVDAERASRARPGDVVVLDGPEGKHAGVVQRLAPGEALDLVDGCGTRLRGRVLAVDGPQVTVDVSEVLREEPDGVRLVLVQALAKGDRDDLAIEAATEVGVDEVVPWQAERSVVVWRGERAARSRARWVTTVRAATKQSRRAWEPPVTELATTAALAERVRRAVADGGAALVLHEQARVPVAGVRLPEPGAGTHDVLLVVGPEGGISDRETALLEEAGATAVRMGPHVLRTSTAGPVAVALLSERLGRWG